MVEVQNGSDCTLKQYVWGLQYVDELCQIMLAPFPGETNKPNHPFWVLQDANFNTLGVVSRTGRLVERYEYTPYGQRTVFSHGYVPADFNDDGTVDSIDYTTYSNHYGSGTTIDEGDANGDGTVDTIDYAIWANNYGKTAAYLDDPLVMYPRLGSFVKVAGTTTGNPIALCDTGHQGLLHDREFSLIYNRNRYYHPTLARFTSRDPLMYVDGMSMYEYVGSCPVGSLDPLGLEKPGVEGFVDELLETATRYNHWYYGCDYEQRCKAARRIAIEFIPQKEYRYIIGGFGGKTRPWRDITGLRNDLTQGGQNSAAYRHIASAAALVMRGCSIIVDIGDIIDDNQEITEKHSEQEKQAEILGNEAGREAGHILNKYLEALLSR